MIIPEGWSGLSNRPPRFDKRSSLRTLRLERSGRLKIRGQTGRDQYKNPKSQSGIFFPNPFSISSKAKKLFSMSFIWENPFFLPPISKRYLSSTRKSPCRGAFRIWRSLKPIKIFHESTFSSWIEFLSHSYFLWNAILFYDLTPYSPIISPYSLLSTSYYFPFLYPLPNIPYAEILPYS